MAQEIWWTAPAEGAGGSLIMVSGRDGLDKYRESGKYNDRITLRWPYGGKGMPPASVQELMEQADDLLRLELKKEKGVILTGIYTGVGEREWVFYVKNPSIFQSLLNRAWASLPLLPVQIEAERDPEWEEYAEMREATYIPDAD